MGKDELEDNYQSIKDEMKERLKEINLLIDDKDKILLKLKNLK